MPLCQFFLTQVLQVQQRIEKKNGKKMWLKIIELINVKNLIRSILLGKTFLGLRSTYTKQIKLQWSLIHLTKDLIVYEVNLRWLVFCLGMDGRWCYWMLYRLGRGNNLVQQVWLLPTALLQAHSFTWLSRMRVSAQRWPQSLFQSESKCDIFVTVIGHLHDNAIWLQLPESFRIGLSHANYRYCYFYPNENT